MDLHNFHIGIPIENCNSKFFSHQALEGEVCRLSQSLEASLLEKGEIASRLNSTQDEVMQMRSGIEKLQVRIESDERKKKKMGELLKGSFTAPLQSYSGSVSVRERRRES